MSTKRLLAAVAALAVAALLAWPVFAEAQARGRGGAPPPPRGGSHVVVRAQAGWGYGYGPRGPYAGWYGGWRPYGGWYGGWGPYGGWGGYYYDYLYASARIEVLPKEAEVFVDGYRAGVVDDFDGFFQRLNAWPGEHEITLYLEGYKTERHLIYMSQGTTANLKGTMEKLAPGAKSEPPPQPAPREQARQGGQDQPRYTSGGQQNPPEPAPAQQAPVSFGGVSIKVQPADAVIVIDDQLWTGPGGDQRLNVQLAVGRHHVEIRKDGFVTYAEDVIIRTNATLTLNVNLSKK